MKDYKNYMSTLALIGALVPGLATAAFSEGEGTTQAKVVAPVEVEDTTPLNFGTVTNRGGTIYMESVEGDARLDPDDIGVTDDNSPTTGRITIIGPSGVTVQIVFPSGPVQVYANGSDSAVEVEPVPSDDSVTLGNDGTSGVWVGGSLTVPSGASEGDYEGTYPISVNY